MGGGTSPAMPVAATGFTETEIAEADAVMYQLIRLIRLFDRLAAQFAADSDHGVERAAYVLLVHLIGTGPQRAGALAEAVYSDPSTVSRQIAQLVRAGLVERRQDPADGRACLLAATAEGKQTFEENRRRRNEFAATVLRDWSSSERRQFTDLLTRLAFAVQDHRPDAGRATQARAAVGDRP